MKLLLSLVWLFVLAAVIVDAVPVDPSIKINCLIKHLKASKMLEESYPSHPGASIDDCTDLIKEATETILQGVIFGLQMKNFENYEDCVVSSLKASNWREETFLMIVYTSSETLSVDEKEAKAQETKSKIDEIANKVIGSCIYSDIFSELFDKLIVTAANDDQADSFQKYCERKYVVDNHLIDSSYDVVLNPKNLDVSTANCEELLEQTKQGIDRSIAEKLSTEFGLGGSRACAQKRFKELRFADKIVAVIVLGETRLTERQREGEKKKFIETVINIVDEVDKCKA